MKKLIQLIEKQGLFSRVTGHCANEIWDYDFLAVYQEDDNWYIAPAYVDGTKIKLVNNVHRTFATTTNLWVLAEYVRGEMLRDEEDLDTIIQRVLETTNSKYSFGELKDMYFKVENYVNKVKGGAQ